MVFLPKHCWKCFLSTQSLYIFNLFHHPEWNAACLVLAHSMLIPYPILHCWNRYMHVCTTHQEVETNDCFSCTWYCYNVLYWGEMLAPLRQPSLINMHQYDSLWCDILWWYSHDREPGWPIAGRYESCPGITLPDKHLPLLCLSWSHVCPLHLAPWYFTSCDRLPHLTLGKATFEPRGPLGWSFSLFQ